MTAKNKVMPRPGHPASWDERTKDTPTGYTLPDGAEWYITPGHGYLRVDFNILPASVSEFDYLDEPHHALLEEDCSATMWLAEYGLIPMEEYILEMLRTIPRTSAYGLMHPGSVVIEAGIVAGIDGTLYQNKERIIAGPPRQPAMLDRLAAATAARLPGQPGELITVNNGE